MFYTEESTNQYLNDNWRPVSDALKPIIAKTIEDILLGILYKVFNYVPADYLVSDIAKPSELYKTEQWTHRFLILYKNSCWFFIFCNLWLWWRCTKSVRERKEAKHNEEKISRA